MPFNSISSRPFRRSSVAIVAFALATGCGGGGSGPGDSPADGDASVLTDGSSIAAGPALLETIPADGASGVESETAFVFRFTQPMDPAATLAAYQSDTLPAASVVFLWNDAADTLTVVPKEPLPYAEGDALVSPLAFAMHIGTGATNAAGVPLAEEATLGFTTLRRVIVMAEPVASLTGRVSSVNAASTAYFGVGDFASGAGLASFATFSLAAVPAGTTIEMALLRIDEGVIAGTPDDDLGQLSAQHVFFEVLDGSAYGLEPLAVPSNSAPFERSKGEPFLRGAVLTELVQDDLDNRASRNDRTQCRARFDVASDTDGVTDYVTFTPGSASLEIRYLVE